MSAGVPMRTVGAGTLLLGLPSHLVMLNEPAVHRRIRVTMSRARTVVAKKDRMLALTKAVLRAVGRPPQCRLEELPERLAEDGAAFDPDELGEVLVRLEDVGQLLRAQRNPGYPLYLISSSHSEFDDTDALAADVCSVLKRRGDRFGNDEELRSYLDGDGVTYTPESLAVALRQLEGLGRIVRNRVDQFDPDSMLPGVYAEPRIIAR